MKFTYPLIALLCFSPLFLLAQKGSISGKIIDAKFADALIGASVRLEEGAGGAVTDLDGNFTIGNVPVGKHKITVNYTGYSPKTIDNVEVKNNEVTTVDIALEEPSVGTTITEVVVVATALRSSQSALTILQKNSPVIADGISAETIKRTPDRTTGDVIRRVSGASIQDGRFAVIRGLNDRYNVAMVNGSLLSSTEPDRRAFSFDIFPSALIDNLIVMKTASPDLPGEFAGGTIVINTKDIPEENYLNVSVSAGSNFLSTFKPYSKGTSGSTDWLGIEDGSRALPASMPATRGEYLALSERQQQDVARAFSNTWATTRESSARPNLGTQLIGGLLKKLNDKSSLGATLGMTYNNSYRFQLNNRKDYDAQSQIFEFNDSQYNNSVLWGALANFGYTFNSRNKLVFQNSYTVNTDNNVFQREGQELQDGFDLRSQAIEFTQTNLFSTRFAGEHAIGERKFKLNWGLGYNQTERNVPDQRRFLYRRPTPEPGDEPAPFSIFVPSGGGDPYRMGRVFLNLNEDVYNANLDFAVPFKLFGQGQTLKVGGLFQHKDRDFAGRLLGVVKAQTIVRPGLLQQPIETIFSPENFASDGFVLDDVTQNSDRYDAESDLSAGFAMLQNNFGRFKLTYGLRLENFRQALNSFDETNAPVNINRTTSNLLPSLNATYALNEQQNLRFSASQTVSRPEFRELAPFSFFDFVTQTLITGEPELRNANVYNFDLRYEIFPGMNQVLSVSAFFKHFDNPIEQVVASSGATTRIRTFRNIPSARNYGVEFEVRKNFGFVNEKFENLVAFANLALIRSELDLSNTNSPNPDRPLQGQSPYVANAGIQANFPKWGLNATAVYNVVGDRVFEVGFVGYNDIYERRRNLLDFQLSKKIGKRGEIKLNCQDLLAQDFVFYQDQNKNNKYDATTDAKNPQDNLVQRINAASTVSLSFGYRF